MRVLSVMMMVWTDSCKKRFEGRGLFTTLARLIWEDHFDVEE